MIVTLPRVCDSCELGNNPLPARSRSFGGKTLRRLRTPAYWFIPCPYRGPAAGADSRLASAKLGTIVRFMASRAGSRPERVTPNVLRALREGGDQLDRPNLGRAAVLILRWSFATFHLSVPARRRRSVGSGRVVSATARPSFSTSTKILPPSNRLRQAAEKHVNPLLHQRICAGSQPLHLLFRPPGLVASG